MNILDEMNEALTSKKVFLGGICANSKWSCEPLIKKVKKSSKKC